MHKTITVNFRTSHEQYKLLRKLAADYGAVLGEPVSVSDLLRIMVEEWGRRDFLGTAAPVLGTAARTE